MALFLFPVSHDSVTVSHRAQYHEPATEAVKWNSAILNLLGLFAAVFWTVTKFILWKRSKEI